MPKKTANIKVILAANLKENRKKKGLTQEKLAELADMSLHYLAMLEIGKYFPSGEMVEKLAKALNIQAYQLFYPLATPDGAMSHLEQSIVANIQKVFGIAVNQSPNEKQSGRNKPQKEELEQQLQDILSKINKTINKAVKNSFEEHRQDLVEEIGQTVSKAVDQSVSKAIKETLAEENKKNNS